MQADSGWSDKSEKEKTKFRDYKEKLWVTGENRVCMELFSECSLRSVVWVPEYVSV